MGSMPSLPHCVICGGGPEKYRPTALQQASAQPPRSQECLWTVLGSNPDICQLPSTTGVHTPIPPCGMRQGWQAHGFRFGVRCPAHYLFALPLSLCGLNVCSFSEAC